MLLINRFFWLSLGCFKCGEEGHISRDCPKAGAGGGRGRGEIAFVLVAKPLLCQCSVCGMAMKYTSHPLLRCYVPEIFGGPSLGVTVIGSLDLQLEIAGSISAAALSSATLGMLFRHIASVSKQYNWVLVEGQ